MHTIKIPDHILKIINSRRGGVSLFDRLSGPSTALVVIDLQNAFMLAGSPMEVPIAREIVPNVNRLAQAVRSAGGKVVWIKMTVQDELKRWNVFFDNFYAVPERRAGMLKVLSRGDPGHEIHTDMDVQPSDLIVEKTRYSAFIQGSSELDRILKELGIDTVIITGTATNVCCESSARDAMMLNYKMVCVSDGTACRTDEEQNAALAILLRSFGDVLTTDEVISRLSK